MDMFTISSAPLVDLGIGTLIVAFTSSITYGIIKRFRAGRKHSF
jgi:hypothetical protein